MVDTRVNLCGLELDNPVIPASGTFGFGREFSQFYDLNILGSIAIKGITKAERFGNEQPRIAECTSGMINSVGLQNPGVKRVIAEEIPDLMASYHKKIIANISGFSIKEYEDCVKVFNKCEDVGILEINISCPNVHGGGMAFGQDPTMAAKVTKAVKSKTDKPVFIKLSPNVTDIVEIALSCQEAGADGLSLVNTFLGSRIDIKKRDFIIANKIGGFSGPAIFPIALRMVYQVALACDIPIIGIGGISKAEDVLEMIMAGASAVQVGAANLVDPYTCKKIIEDLPRLMEELDIQNFDEIRGCVIKD